MEARRPSGRNRGLDGLRGMAALSVALGHCFLQVTGLPLWKTRMHDFPHMAAWDIGMRVFSTLFPSDAAVMVFFVLSGHVLWESFRRKSVRFFPDLPDYVSARVYRLFPVVIVSSLPLGLLTAVPAADLVRNMLLLSHNVNGVLWSLQVEVVASLALFVVWGLSKGNPLTLAAILVCAAAVTPFFRGEPAIMFFPAFLLGAAISSMPVRMWHSRVLLGGAIAVLVFTNIIFGHAGMNTRFAEILGATVLVGAVAHGNLVFLRSRVVLFLGAISYPFYLMHVIGLALADPLLQSLPPLSPLLMIAARAVASISLTIPLAWLLHVLVEDPVLRARPRLGWQFSRAPGEAITTLRT